MVATATRKACLALQTPTPHTTDPQSGCGGEHGGEGMEVLRQLEVGL